MVLRPRGRGRVGRRRHLIETAWIRPGGLFLFRGRQPVALMKPVAGAFWRVATDRERPYWAPFVLPVGCKRGKPRLPALDRMPYERFDAPESTVILRILVCCLGPVHWGVGQLADRRTVNPEVAGSSPAAPASSFFSKPIYAGDWSAGAHPFPFRTRALGPTAPMVLRPRGRGKLGRRRHPISRRPPG